MFFESISPEILRTIHARLKQSENFKEHIFMEVFNLIINILFVIGIIFTIVGSLEDAEGD